MFRPSLAIMMWVDKERAVLVGTVNCIKLGLVIACPVSGLPGRGCRCPRGLQLANFVDGSVYV